MVKFIVTLVAVLMMGLASTCMAAGYQLMQDKYTAENGDSLDSITIKYISKNTYGVREFKEFKSGIIELNPWLLEREVKPGDIIYINYWIKKVAE